MASASMNVAEAVPPLPKPLSSGPVGEQPHDGRQRRAQAHAAAEEDLPVGLDGQRRDLGRPAERHQDQAAAAEAGCRGSRRAAGA